jgi:hypothetical protein
MEIFRSGFIGATTDEATLWVAEQCKGAKSICVPFAGSGKDIASMAQAAEEGVQIDSWDVQYLSHAVVNGIFAAKEPEITIEYPMFTKGRMYDTRFIKDMDARCAGFFDYVVKYGSLFEKSALISATIRSTMVGRITHWTGDIHDFWKRYQNTLKRNEQWVHLNKGHFNHTLGSFYDDEKRFTEIKYDVVQIDPPKVTTTRDVYSKGPFEKLNYCLDGPEIMPWKRLDVIPRLRTTFNVRAKKIVFLYVTGVRPTPEELERVLPDYGEIVEKKEFHHHSRTDIGYVVE